MILRKSLIVIELNLKDNSKNSKNVNMGTFFEATFNTGRFFGINFLVLSLLK